MKKPQEGATNKTKMGTCTDLLSKQKMFVFREEKEGENYRLRSLVNFFYKVVEISSCALLSLYIYHSHFTDRTPR